MAAGKYKFALDKDMPLKDMIKGLEPMLPVGARSFQLVESDGTKDANGEYNMTVTDLSSIQDELHKEDDNWDWDKACFKDPEMFYNSDRYIGAKKK